MGWQAIDEYLEQQGARVVDEPVHPWERSAPARPGDKGAQRAVPRPPRRQRDHLIVRRYRSGERVALIAADYGLTTMRVYQILNAHGIRREERSA